MPKLTCYLSIYHFFITIEEIHSYGAKSSKKIINMFKHIIKNMLISLYD